MDPLIEAPFVFHAALREAKFIPGARLSVWGEL
jgi:hypothetical protein